MFATVGHWRTFAILGGVLPLIVPDRDGDVAAAVHGALGLRTSRGLGCQQTGKYGVAQRLRRRFRQHWEATQMTLRILSGFIHRIAPIGSVTIGFNPHVITARDTHSTVSKLSDQREIGPARDFTGIPTKIVALRHLKFDRKHGANPVEDFAMELKVGDTVTATHLTVTWNAGGSLDLTRDFTRILPIEISYMVIGETA